MTKHYRQRTSTPATAVALCLMILSAVACGGDKKAPTITAPDGFTAAGNDKEGFALAVPSDWTVIPLRENPADFDAEANRLRLANPKLASILNQARVLGQSGGKFMAVAPDGVANANLTIDKPKEKTVEQIVTASMDALKNIEASNFSQEPATLAGKPAIKLSFRLPVDTDNGRVPFDEVQHYLLDDKKAYILTVAAATPAVASTIAGSVKLR